MMTEELPRYVEPF